MGCGLQAWPVAWAGVDVEVGGSVAMAVAVIVEVGWVVTVSVAAVVGVRVGDEAALQALRNRNKREKTKKFFIKKSSVFSR
jgi:hypothetical protein